MALPVSRNIGPILTFALLALASMVVRAQEPSGLEMAHAMEGVLVDVIAGAEKSVVAIARVDKPRDGENLNRELRPNPLNLPRPPVVVPNPSDPDFIPNEFATGVVVDRSGLILTAYHVLGDNSDYFVTCWDHRVYRAWIKAADPRSDLAVLAIDRTDLAPITLGDAGKLRKGRIVISLGNPYAIARDGQVSASWGIVSNLARKTAAIPTPSDPTGKTTLHHFGTLIQTDAKLNLGTSGGPLLDLNGRMVGLTTSLAAIEGYETSAGYAFPVDDAFLRVLNTLKQGREVEYGFLGIQPFNLSLEEAVSGLHGTRVRHIVPGAPAAKHGVKSGDVITSVNGKEIFDSDGLVLEVGRLPVEAVVELGVWREDRELNLKVTLVKFPVRGRKIVTTPAPDWRGMRIDYPTAITDDLSGGGLDSAFFDAGVVVTDVEEGTPAWTSGVRPGQIISHVNGQAVRTPKQFRAAVANKSGDVRLRFHENVADSPAEAVVPAS